jgi:hypothetical protein
LIVDLEYKNCTFFIGEISSEEMESQYNLLEMLFAKPEVYRNVINAI